MPKSQVTVRYLPDLVAAGGNKGSQSFSTSITSFVTARSGPIGERQRRSWTHTEAREYIESK